MNESLSSSLLFLLPSPPLRTLPLLQTRLPRPTIHHGSQRPSSHPLRSHPRRRRQAPASPKSTRLPKAPSRPRSPPVPVPSPSSKRPRAPRSSSPRPTTARRRSGARGSARRPSTHSPPSPSASRPRWLTAKGVCEQPDVHLQGAQAGASRYRHLEEGHERARVLRRRPVRAHRQRREQARLVQQDVRPSHSDLISAPDPADVVLVVLADSATLGSREASRHADRPLDDR